MLSGGHFKFEKKSLEEQPGLRGSAEMGKVTVLAEMGGGLFPEAILSIACAEGIDGKLFLRKVNMGHSVINCDGCHEGHESSIAREGCRCDGLHWQHLNWKQKEKETLMQEEVV